MVWGEPISLRRSRSTKSNTTHSDVKSASCTCVSAGDGEGGTHCDGGQGRSAGAHRVEHVADCDDVRVVEMPQDTQLAQDALRLGHLPARGPDCAWWACAAATRARMQRGQWSRLVEAVVDLLDGDLLRLMVCWSRRPHVAICARRLPPSGPRWLRAGRRAASARCKGLAHRRRGQCG